MKRPLGQGWQRVKRLPTRGRSTSHLSLLKTPSDGEEKRGQD